MTLNKIPAAGIGSTHNVQDAALKESSEKKFCCGNKKRPEGYGQDDAVDQTEQYTDPSPAAPSKAAPAAPIGKAGKAEQISPAAPPEQDQSQLAEASYLNAP